jgi:hypothetical protein
VNEPDRFEPSAPKTRVAQACLALQNDRRREALRTATAGSPNQATRNKIPEPTLLRNSDLEPRSNRTEPAGRTDPPPRGQEAQVSVVGKFAISALIGTWAITSELPTTLKSARLRPEPSFVGGLRALTKVISHIGEGETSGIA